MFKIDFDSENGGAKSISNTNDKNGMNWVEGANVFGTVKNAETVSVNKTENGVIAVYKTDCFNITVTRRLSGERYRETYVFENSLDSDVFVGRGDIGIYATFNDSYENSKLCMTERCHTHIWCGKSTSYVKAVKMGVFPFGLALVLTKGKLDSYSISVLQRLLSI